MPKPSGAAPKVAQKSPHTTSNPPSPDSLPPIPQVAGSSVGQRIQGKVAIITGANSITGIGRATARVFAESGARAIYICDLTGQHLAAQREELQRLFSEVEVHVRQFDAADEAAMKGVVDEALEKYGRLDIMFANAAIIGTYRPFGEIDGDSFMRTLKMNVLSVFVATKYGSKAMMKTSSVKPQPSGSIIATSSVAGLRANAGSSDYSASKAAVISLMQTACFGLSGSNIRCNAICPGLTETGMTQLLFDNARANGNEKKVGQLNPQQRGAIADEVARVALFLASDESSYVNGQAWAVDGGLSAGHPFIPGKLA